jgi:hypothetical protein
MPAAIGNVVVSLAVLALSTVAGLGLGHLVLRGLSFSLFSKRRR